MIFSDGIGSILSLLFSLPILLVLICIILLPICVIANVVAARTARKQYERDLALWKQESPKAIVAWKNQCVRIKAEWQSKMDNWKRLYYCPRCDHVYNSETNEAAPTSEMKSIL